ncbi:hypothetical protein [Thermocoleostomius sinensis]|uniref:Uncharacterized protein n=1 Tax=Thermocoleostomius sinensis A174 TaxID=2016057 RepID=A0A9E8ZHW0_9CYAN|nr:hypothetical protein [Thermocoleostomius sinensis]WAL61583.1 hypothetical protein OXH18_06245 [Thermocoleostomius sinensis A174]
MKTSNHLVVGYAFEEALNREAQARHRSVERNRKCRFHALLNACGRILFHNAGEPQIRQHIDRAGFTYWQVYDPQTDRSQQFDSETEVRQWLDRRYCM